MGAANRWSHLALLLMVAALAGGSNAEATVVRDQKSGSVSNPGVEAGGHRLLPSGSIHLSCTQYGVRVTDVRGLSQFGTSSWNMLGGLSFQRPGDSGRTMILPIGDGGTTCVVSPDR